uniref:Fam20C domain-containing protein n=1 Tax=Trichuris muris TaxID=70415 RepID=A0A5S6QRH0_TRIMR
MRFRLRYLLVLFINAIVTFLVVYFVNRKCTAAQPPQLPRILARANATEDRAVQSRFAWATISPDIRNTLKRLAGVRWEKLLAKPDCENRFVYPSLDFIESESVPIVRTDAWSNFIDKISSCEVYRDNNLLKEAMHQLSTMKIVRSEILRGGTQVKLLLTFENGRHGVFKPMRFDRNHEADPNHFYFSDFERHHSEIAAFHLDKVLGYRRAIPTVGRVLNLTSDLMETADETLKDTFFYSPVGNVCFVSLCKYYCMTGMAICGKPDQKEGSLQMFISHPHTPFRRVTSPYRRTYSKKKQKAEWQQDNTYCQRRLITNASSPFSKGRMLLDLIDLSVLDFLMGNQDRHHMDAFDFGDVKDYSSVHVDNGRGFGRSDFDDFDIILPLVQCEALRQSLSADPVSPVLATKHLVAVNRRLEIILFELAKCILKAEGDYKAVLIQRMPMLHEGMATK